MDNHNRDSWFNKIAQPNSITHGDGIGYLDRLMGKPGGPDKKQFFQCSNFKQNKSKINPKQCNQSDRAKFATISPAVAGVDDIQWLEARRKKFPRANNDVSPPSPPPPPSNVHPIKDSGKNSMTGTDHQLEKQPDGHDDRSSKSKKPSAGTAQRKKTLFEKLMESSD